MAGLVFLTILSIVYAADQVKKCHDVNEIACQKMFAKRRDMCDDPCIANICKDTCRYCPVTCYHCNEESTPEGCTKVQQCLTTNQLCIAAERYTTDFHSTYTSGCAEKELCHSLFGFDSTKREVEATLNERSYHLHGGCCDSNLCNMHDPSNVTSTIDPSSRPPKPTGTNPLLGNTTHQEIKVCEENDLDTEACRLLNSTDPTICQNNCIAATLCPSFCGTCLHCRDCKSVPDPGSCNNTTLCKKNQQCVTIERLDSNLQLSIVLGCMDSKICTAYFSGRTGGPGGFGKRQFGQTTLRGKCCDSDMCNEHGIQ
ncbi:uncharacterized protein LOC133176487 isoform X1 [Saccostrea echinata]|uniref:uncharacterized protein LOC133176487 isoform X1 n=2 Tax=Saccostrea echinata TaxID=191078 RepID=UPI002A83B021|nr:uncharacterized protein LOC133176487 isoform X1 [Saccostrea echinata]